MLFRLATTCGVYRLVLAPFGVYGSWWGPFAGVRLASCSSAWPSRVWVYGYSARLTSEEGFGVLFRLGVFPLFLFSGAFFPISNLGTVGEWVARLHPAVARRQPVADVLPSTTSPGGWPRVNVACLVVLTVVGWFWAVSGLEKRLVS